MEENNVIEQAEAEAPEIEYTEETLKGMLEAAYEYKDEVSRAIAANNVRKLWKKNKFSLAEFDTINKAHKSKIREEKQAIRAQSAEEAKEQKAIDKQTKAEQEELRRARRQLKQEAINGEITKFTSPDVLRLRCPGYYAADNGIIKLVVDNDGCEVQVPISITPLTIKQLISNMYSDEQFVTVQYYFNNR